MIWLVITLMSANTVKDIDHKSFKSYTECEQYVEQLSNKSKSCFTSYAQFKQSKKVKHEPSRNDRRITTHSK